MNSKFKKLLPASGHCPRTLDGACGAYTTLNAIVRDGIRGTSPPPS